MGVLDYNAHINRDKAQNKEGDIIYARKFRKQTKKWDASPTLEKKQFSYVPNIVKEIESQWCDTTCTMKTTVRSPHDTPATIQSTIGNSQPSSTNDIVIAKKSRFI